MAAPNPDSPGARVAQIDCCHDCGRSIVWWRVDPKAARSLREASPFTRPQPQPKARYRRCAGCAARMHAAANP